ncbi:hypothetical protein BD324DRAFT_629447 [Kockovaella imperatae]|uniref:Nucleotide-diphospho-sugar transferase n=1 Tax=Kockovaella imperatae TaxID=4999 RepID=A0A1Y1UD36_9TREE|nr:hypothetical protein BD324DRAFT_629447 [Kockovaella imperatae]ORX35899.1 hypothetical protein BD324DRAFT_629447 [Kockovaella imperatae]
MALNHPPPLRLIIIALIVFIIGIVSISHHESSPSWSRLSKSFVDNRASSSSSSSFSSHSPTYHGPSSISSLSLKDSKSHAHHDTLPKVHLFIPINQRFAYKDDVFCKSIQSAIVNGWEPILFNWELIHAEHKKEKIRGLQKILSSSKYTSNFHDDDLIFMMDADVCLQLPPQVLAKRFVEEYDKKVLVAAEKNCSPNGKNTHACLDAPPAPLIEELFWLSEEPHVLDLSEKLPTHANSGTVLGRFKKMKKFYNELVEFMKDDPFTDDDDQHLFNEAVADRKVDLDFTARLFWPAGDDSANFMFMNTPQSVQDDADPGITPWELYPPLGWHTLFGHPPVGIHFAGDVKDRKKEWWNKLWWASHKRFRRIVRERMDRGQVEFVEEDGYSRKTIQEVCPKLEVWDWDLLDTRELHETEQA